MLRLEACQRAAHPGALEALENDDFALFRLPGGLGGYEVARGEAMFTSLLLALPCDVPQPTALPRAPLAMFEVYLAPDE